MNHEDNVTALAEARLDVRRTRNRIILEGPPISARGWPAVDGADGDEAFYAFDADHDAWFEAESRQGDRGRVMGYALACCEIMRWSQSELEKAVDALMAARERAEEALSARNKALVHAEDIARCAKSGDVAWWREVAAVLEGWIG